MSEQRDPRPAEEASAYVRAVEEREPANVGLAGKGVGHPRPSGARLSTAVSGVLASKWLGLVVAVLALLLPFVNSTTYVIQIATDALIFIVLAVGLNIVVGFCGLLDLGYAAFFAIGAYTSGVLATKFGWPVAATIPVVVVAAVAGGLIIGGPTLRLRTDYLAIVTLGFGEIIRITANNLDFTGGPNGLYGIPDFGDFGLRPNIAVYWVSAALACLAVLFSSRLGRGRIGRAWRFVREDEDAAEAMGIHTYKVKFAAYIAGAVFGGIAGVLFAVHQTAISPPSFNFLWSALILMAVVLGGMGSTPGVVVGALVISLLPELLRGAENWRYLIFGVLLIIIMIFRPQGLLPARPGEPRRRGRRVATGAPPSVDRHARSRTEGAPLLDVREMAVSFGGVHAVDGLTFSIHEGEVLSIIGPNGAGKTSAFNCITGFYKPSGGSVRFAGAEVAGKRPAVIAANGIARTFQNLRLFGDLTVLDNVRAGMHVRIRQNFLDAMLHTPRYWRAEDTATNEANKWLDFVGMEHDRTARIRNLPYGEQRRVEIARALAREPRMLLLDEPAAGLNHGEKARLLDLLRRIAGLGIAVVLIEHDMGLVMEVSERIVVLSYGKEIADGTPAQIRSNPAVIEAYLGAEDEDAHLEAERIAAEAKPGGPEALS
jgi:branched-chain amino acid transport system permease protein